MFTVCVSDEESSCHRTTRNVYYETSNISPNCRQTTAKNYCVHAPFLVPYCGSTWGLVWRSGYGTALLFRWSRDRFPVVTLDFSVTHSFRPDQFPGVDSAPNENGCQEYFVRVKAAGVWGWQPHRLHVPNAMKICEPKASGSLWDTPGLLRDCFNFHCGPTNFIFLFDFVLYIQG